MIGNFLSRGLVMIFGYAYPAYECYKTVEKNKAEIEQLRFWCQYWILIALMTVFERIGDAFVSWLPMYGETKLAFIIYLWYPKTKGTKFVYDSFFRPYVAKHEKEIDRNLLELKTRAGDMVSMYFQKVAGYGQTRIFEILQFVASQSNPRSRATQPQQPAPKTGQPPAAAPRQPSSTRSQPEPEIEEPPSPTSSSTSSQQNKESEEELSSASALAPARAPSPLKKSVSMPVAPESSDQSATNVEGAMQTESVSAKAEKLLKKSPPSPDESVMEETIRVTRGRLRKTRSTISK